MNPKTLHNLTWLPPFAIGLSACILGLSWVFSSEPWMLDQKANEILIQTSYENLFQAEINAHLPEYLKAIYGFFGWWVFSMGILIMLFVQVTRLGTRLARNSVHTVLGIILSGIYILEFNYIPSSPFVWLTHGLVVLLLVSMVASQRLKKHD